ncbi:hypothetical protein [Armatimonas sp.]|uniref:hypothetical protein n=1 Tax=Armatimonas sp. TaxID=1872638 RepID=UPI00286AAE24|nr:hypothetical protein [Armatimonas sp.]
MLLVPTMRAKPAPPEKHAAKSRHGRPGHNGEFIVIHHGNGDYLVGKDRIFHEIPM